MFLAGPSSNTSMTSRPGIVSFSLKVSLCPYSISQLLRDAGSKSGARVEWLESMYFSLGPGTQSVFSSSAVFLDKVTYCDVAPFLIQISHYCYQPWRGGHMINFLLLSFSYTESLKVQGSQPAMTCMWLAAFPSYDLCVCVFVFLHIYSLWSVCFPPS